MDKIKLKALGKINLGLDVLGRRPNGYHDVRMVMQTVYLYDQILLEKTDKEGISLETNLFYLPVNENNLAYRAAKMLIDEFAIKEGVHISLEKHIPVAAGMAGGSSNAAAVLYGMNRLFQLGLTDQELMDRSVQLGADVPYCIMRNCFGRGNRRKTDAASGDAEVPCAVGKPAYQCIDTEGVRETGCAGSDKASGY